MEDCVRKLSLGNGATAEHQRCESAFLQSYEDLGSAILPALREDVVYDMDLYTSVEGDSSRTRTWKPSVLSAYVADPDKDLDFAPQYNPQTIPFWATGPCQYLCCHCPARVEVDGLIDCSELAGP